jgi:hypothetical protein
MKSGAVIANSFARLGFSQPPSSYFALRRFYFPPIERHMGQQHRVRVKRRRRANYLDRKKAAAKAAPTRREVVPKTKAKPRKQSAAPA